MTYFLGDISGQFRTRLVLNLGQFRTLLRSSNFETREFPYKANSLPYAII